MSELDTEIYGNVDIHAIARMYHENRDKIMAAVLTGVGSITVSFFTKTNTVIIDYKQHDIDNPVYSNFDIILPAYNLIGCDIDEKFFNSLNVFNAGKNDAQ